MPDHGKLSPWRFVVLKGEAKAALRRRAWRRSPRRGRTASRLRRQARQDQGPAADRGGDLARYADGEIPEWEQRLSAGAVCMTLIIAAQAMGYGANWITDWYAYDAEAGTLLGLDEGERVAGFVHLGTAPSRRWNACGRTLDTLVTEWRG